MKKRLALILLSLILLIPAGLFAMLNTETGSRWLLRRILSALPAQTSIQKVEGRLLNRIGITGFHYQTETETVDINHFNLTWQPSRLLFGRLKIVDLSADGISVNLAPSDTTEESPPFDWRADFAPPIQITVDKLAITQLHYQSGDDQMTVQHLTLSATTERNRLILRSLSLTAEPVSIKADGAVLLGKQFPFSLQSHWQLDTAEYGRWQADTMVEGDVNQIKLSSSQSSPFELKVEGRINELLNKPEFDIRGDWKRLAWPFTGSEQQFVSAQGFVEIKGSSDDYQVKLDGPLTQAYLPEAELHFTGHGSSEAITIDDFHIVSSAGSFNLDGNIGWLDATTFDINAKGQDFNPGIFAAELAGKLTFDAHAAGTLNDNSQKIQAEIRKLSGRLHDKPVEAQGRLAMVNDIIDIDNLHIRSGRNRIDAHGKLAPVDSNLKFNIDTPALAALWPGLAGTLKADGHIQGNWQNPITRIQANADALKYQENGVEKLRLLIDYQPDEKKSSNFQLDVSRLTSGTHQIDKLMLEGKGTPAKHRFNLDIKGSQASLSGTISGGLEKQAWQGKLQKITIATATAGTWRLRHAADLTASKQDAGFDASLSRTCVERNAAFLCMDADYRANRDFAVKLDAASLPTDLFSAFFPDNLGIKGIVNANADLKQQKGGLSGTYRVEMPAPTKIALSDETAEHELNLGKLTLDGRLKQTVVTANADLALAERDYLRAELELNTDSSGTLSGRITASVTQWALFRAFIPQATEIKGQLSADLSLRGSASSPRIAGNLNLRNGAVTLPEAGIALNTIALDVFSPQGPHNQIRVNGAFAPQFLSEPDANYQPHFDGRLNFSANLRQQQNAWYGDYRLNIPADSKIDFKTPETKVELAFMSSSLAGELNGSQIDARLDLQLRNQDFLRANFEVDTGPSDRLSGQLNTHIHDLGQFNALVPGLADVTGQIKGDLLIKGTTQQPQSVGSVKLSQASTTVTPLGISIQDIELNLVSGDVYAGRLMLSGHAKSGGGDLNIHGLTDLKGNGEIQLQGSDFEIAKLPEAEVALSPDLNLKLDEMTGKAKGRITVPKAKIVMQELPKNAVVVSQDEVIVGAAESEKKPVAEPDIDTDIDIELGDQVSFSGLGLDTKLVGRLNMVKEQQRTRLHGEIEMKKGRYQSYGQDLTIRKGRFVFNGPIDAPWLDVEASRLSKDQKVTAILSVSGPLKTPKTKVYSEPALPESEALAYLITGSSLDQVGKSDGNMLASAALSYGAGQFSWLTEKLGIDEFEVKQGKTMQDTLVALGEYLTPDFYVGTQLGIFNSQAVLVLKKKLTQSFSVESQSGTSHRVKLNYEVETN
ncbi:translocation/assembly module TamB domain-containing protein [Methylomonas sp. MgM2]